MTQATEKPPLMKWSLNKYHELVKTGVLEDCRVELLNGQIAEMPPVEPIREELADYLRSILGDRVKVREATAVTTLPDDSESIPDIVVVYPQRYRNRHPYPEDVYLIIEIANSRPGRDLGPKSLERRYRSRGSNPG